MKRGTTTPRRKLAERRRRDDGVNTKSQLLEAAGVVFAEKGFDRATAKEIAEQAGTNAASVNYYYGGIEGLYEEVLIEAHHRIVSYEDLATTLGEDNDPKEKLRRLIELIVKAVTGPSSSSWAVRVISREMLSPSPHIDALRQKEVQPKVRLVFGLVAELLGLPLDHPVVGRAFFSLAAPCLVLLLMDRRMIGQVIPSLGADTNDAETLIDHMTKFTLGGLSALVEAEAGK